MLAMGGILIAYGIKPQSAQRRTNGDDDYSGAICCSFQVLVIIVFYPTYET